MTQTRTEDRTIHLKTPAELAMMREAGKIVREALEAMRAAAQPGVTTKALDRIAEQIIHARLFELSQDECAQFSGDDYGVGQ